MLTKHFPAMFSWRRQRAATFHVPSAQGRKSMNTWTSSSSNQSLTNALDTDLVASHFTCLGNPLCIPKFSKASGILRRRTDDIQYFLRQMEHILTVSPVSLWGWEWTASSGRGEKITLTVSPMLLSKELDSSGSYSKKRQKGKSKSGKGIGKK